MGRTLKLILRRHHGVASSAICAATVSTNAGLSGEAAMAISFRPTLAHAISGGVGLVLGFIGGVYGPTLTAATADRTLRNDIALQIVRGGTLNDIRQKVDYLCKSGFIDAEKNSWRRRWFDTPNPCDSPTGK
jgi:hypothetical protein